MSSDSISLVVVKKKYCFQKQLREGRFILGRNPRPQSITEESQGRNLVVSLFAELHSIPYH